MPVRARTNARTQHARTHARTHALHLIVVCWAFLLISFGVEEIVHTRWPTDTFAHACAEIKSISTSFMCSPSRNKALIAAPSWASLKETANKPVANRNICSCLFRDQIHLNLVCVHPLPQRSIDSCQPWWPTKVFAHACARTHARTHAHPLPQRSVDSCQPW